MPAHPAAADGRVAMERPPVPEIRSAGGGRTREAILRHLGTGQVSRVIYGAIIGMALIVALQAHPPSATEMTSALLGTAVAVGLAELPRRAR
jgi:hypothetical protein